MKRSPLKRYTPLRSSGRSRQPHSVPKKRRSWPEDVKAAVWRRSNGKCEAGASLLCRGVGSQLHHRQMRSAGGGETEANALNVCSICHRYIHDHPQESYAAGWLVRRQ